MLWKPRWLAGHALVIVLAVIFVLLGIWQLNRNTEKQDKVRKAKAQYAAPAPELTSLRTAPASGARAQVSGTYLPGKDVVLRDQARNGQLGEEVLTPMRLADGTVVLVDRGWLSGGLTNSAPTITPTPTGPVVVRGLVPEVTRAECAGHDQRGQRPAFGASRRHPAHRRKARCRSDPRRVDRSAVADPHRPPMHRSCRSRRRPTRSITWSTRSNGSRSRSSR